MSLFLYRLIGASVLDAAMYEGIEADRTRGATLQALATVVLSSLAAGLGAGSLLGSRWLTFAAVTSLALVTWLAWSTACLAGILIMAGSVVFYFANKT